MITRHGGSNMNDSTFSSRVTNTRGTDAKMEVYREDPDLGGVSETLIHAITILVSENKHLKQELRACKKTLHDFKLEDRQRTLHSSRDSDAESKKQKSEQKSHGARSSQPNHLKDADICWYFLKKKCRFGSRCRYRHFRKECNFYIEDRCRFGEHCWFNHRENKKTSSEDEVAGKADDDKSATNIPVAASDPKQARKTNYLHEPNDSSIKVEAEALPSRKKKNSEEESNASQEKEPKAEKVQTDVSGIVTKASKTSYNSQEESDNPIETKEETAIEALDTGAIESNEESTAFKSNETLQSSVNLNRKQRRRIKKVIHENELKDQKVQADEEGSVTEEAPNESATGPVATKESTDQIVEDPEKMARKAKWENWIRDALSKLETEDFDNTEAIKRKLDFHKKWVSYENERDDLEVFEKENGKIENNCCIKEFLKTKAKEQKKSCGMREAFQ